MRATTKVQHTAPISGRVQYQECRQNIHKGLQLPTIMTKTPHFVPKCSFRSYLARILVRCARVSNAIGTGNGQLLLPTPHSTHPGPSLAPASSATRGRRLSTDDRFLSGFSDGHLPQPPIFCPSCGRLPNSKHPFFVRISGRPRPLLPGVLTHPEASP